VGESPVLSHLFAPLQVGPMTAANRLVMAPMERNYANPDGTVSERTLAHYGACAQGGVGWIDVESTFVDPLGRGRTHQLGLYSDRCLEGFRQLADAVHAGGAKVGIELHHAGRNTSRVISGSQPVAPSPVPCAEAGGDTPRALTRDEIDQIVERYALAAARAASAGFDAVELHSAHGYLPLAFLSPLTNLRTDEYGGPLEQRARFALQVIGAMRSAVGEGIAVGCRFSAEEFLPNGLTLADTIQYARWLERAGVDYLSVTGGVYASFVRIIPPMDFAPGWLLPTAAAIKSAVDVPVIGVSRIVDPRLADAAIAGGQVDLVALGRALLTDPELPRKAREGRLGEIVSCIGCNQGCEARISHQRDVTCLVNPGVGRELELGPVHAATASKRVVVVGGGPAGIEAARTCAERGHDVLLYERSERLGGMVNVAAQLPDRDGWRTFIEQAERRLRSSGVEVRLGRGADEAELTAAGADVIVLATGSRFTLPAELSGDGSVAVLTPIQAVGNSASPIGRAVVAGAEAIGLGVAAWLASRGVEVTVVSDQPAIGDPEGQGALVPRRVESGRVRLLSDREVAGIGDGAVSLRLSGAIGPLFSERIPEVSMLIWTSSRQPQRELVPFGERRPVYEIGDRLTPRSALEAVYEGAVVGRSI
jgi:2,4-dienoyl-CoA reductase-like NADH-dependent reductase (Old Yellow Enzyme family)